jgi:hypothetical protein
MIEAGGSRMHLDSDCCRADCAALFDQFLQSGMAKTY